jgi:hypothetical protein
MSIFNHHYFIKSINLPTTLELFHKNLTLLGIKLIQVCKTRKILPNRTNALYFLVISLVLFDYFGWKNVVSGSPAKITLYQGHQKNELLTKHCQAGVLFKKPEVFSCACVTGV